MNPASYNSQSNLTNASALYEEIMTRLEASESKFQKTGSSFTAVFRDVKSILRECFHFDRDKGDIQLDGIIMDMDHDHDKVSSVEEKDDTKKKQIKESESNDNEALSVLLDHSYQQPQHQVGTKKPFKKTSQSPIIHTFSRGGKAREKSCTTTTTSTTDSYDFDFDINDHNDDDEEVILIDLFDKEEEVIEIENKRLEKTKTKDSKIGEQKLLLEDGEKQTEMERLMRMVQSNTVSTTNDTDGIILINTDHQELQNPKPKKKRKRSLIPRPKIFPCPDCEQSFDSPSRLELHRTCHSDLRPYRCEEPNCPWAIRGFKLKGALKTHRQLVHQQLQPYQCAEDGCGKRFGAKHQLKMHRKVHTGERPYLCTEQGCGARFADRSNFGAHLRIHSGDRPYQCQVLGCGQRFSHNASRKAHYRNKHPGERCPPPPGSSVAIALAALSNQMSNIREGIPNSNNSNDSNQLIGSKVEVRQNLDLDLNLL